MLSNHDRSRCTKSDYMLNISARAFLASQCENLRDTMLRLSTCHLVPRQKSCRVQCPSWCRNWKRMPLHGELHRSPRFYLRLVTTNPPNMDKEDDVGSWIGFAELPTFSLISFVGGLEYHGRIRIVKSSAVIIQHVTYLSLVSFLPEPCVRVLRRTPRLRLALPQR